MTPLRQRMLEDMGVRNLAKNTQAAYVQQVAVYARHFQRSPDVLGPQEVRAYQIYLTQTRKLSPGTVGVATGALRFLYKVTLKRGWAVEEIPMPRKSFRLPVILSLEEVRRFLDSVESLNHRAILMTAYAAGLRVSEARSLARADVEFDRALLTVRNSKFRKSRLVPLHATSVRALQRYAEIRDRKAPWVQTTAFFVSDRGKPLDKRTVHYTFAKLRQALDWRARGGHPAPRIHDLRHTFICQALLRSCRKLRSPEHGIEALSTYVGHAKVTYTYWYVTGIPELMALAARRLRAFCPWRFPMNTPDINTAFARLLQQFFLDRLLQQRNASAQTVASYRDTFRLLLHFAERQLHKPPARLELMDLDASLVLAFLNHLERERKNSIRSRNARLAAIRSFLHYAALKAPTALPSIQSVLAIPFKRFERPMIGFLSQAEITAVLNAPDGASWCGQRDRAMLATLYNTGARVSELIGMRVGDVVLERSASVRIHGKGRKERIVPLWRSTAAQIRRWLPRINTIPDQPLFPNRSSGRMTRSGVTDRLKLACKFATACCPQLAGRHISPHTVRHATAMHMLQAGVDVTLIALCLGHESPATTHMYVEADLAMKERALSAVRSPDIKLRRFKPTDRLLQFLNAL